MRVKFIKDVHHVKPNPQMKQVRRRTRMDVTIARLYQESLRSVDSETVYILQNQDPKNKKTQPIACKSRKCLILIACMIQLLLCNGLGYALSVMYSELIVVFNVRRTDAALVQSFNMGMACGAGIFFTGQIKKYGPGVSIMLASIVCCAGFVLSPLCGQSLWMIILCTGFISGTAMGVIYLASFIAISWTFHENPTVFLVCLMLGTSLGQATLPLLFEVFITQYTWFGTLILAGGLCLHMFPCGLFLHYSRDFYYSGTTTQSSSTGHGVCRTQYTPLLLDFVIWILMVNYFCFAYSSNAEAWFIVDHVVSRGYTREFGSLLASLIGFGSMFGRLLGALLRFKCEYPSIFHWLYTSVAMATLHILVINMDDHWPLIVVCGSLGLSVGTSAALAPAIMFEVTGLELYPQAMAMVNIMYGCAEGLGPIIGGGIKDRSGVYDYVFYMSASMAFYIFLGTMVVMCMMQRRKR